MKSPRGAVRLKPVQQQQNDEADGENINHQNHNHVNGNVNVNNNTRLLCVRALVACDSLGQPGIMSTRV